MGPTPAVDVSRLSKHFPLFTLRRLLTGKWREGVWALREINFELFPGEVLFILGPNGSGKTTLIKLIATLLAPTAGSISIHGFDAARSPIPVKQRLGYITCNEASFYGRLTGWHNLAFFARLHNLDPKVALPPVLEALKLTEYMERRVFTYSTGIKRRLDIARGLLHQPDILLLDEPTTNLDPLSAAELRQLLVQIRDQGKTMIIVTHRLEEVQKIGGRVGIMKQGRFWEVRPQTGENLEELYTRAVGEGEHAVP